MKNYLSVGPRLIHARFPSACAETGQPINVGDQCVYFPRDKKVYHVDSKCAKDFMSIVMDEFS